MRRKKATINFRRKGKGKTNYKKRLKMLLSNLPRLVIRKSLSNTTAQIIEYHPEGDKVLVSSSSRELEKFGWRFAKGNVPAAYLTGFLLGQKAKKRKIEGAVLDIGLSASSKGGRVYAALKGAVDANLKVPYSEGIFPSEDRIKGKHISDFAKKGTSTFSGYKERGIDPEKIKEEFESVKKKISEEK